MFHIRFAAAALSFTLIAGTMQAQDNLDVLYGSGAWMQYTDSRNALYHHFAEEAYRLLEERRKKVESLSSPEAWRQYQQTIRQTLRDVVGPFPDRTPLDAKVVRTIEKDFYRLEHIVFESQPGFYVTSTLFIPRALNRRSRAPAVIYCSGHAPEGYRSQAYQNAMLNLVKKGFVVFAFDPVGQGERLEYYDSDTDKPLVGGPTSQHSFPGTQAFITGTSQARYMIWDGIRAVDYLLTRKEVDPARIGITGRSGGGTQSTYIAAFDDRIAAAAPECYITNFTRLLQSIGPQDAEQNFFNGISKGIDHGDLLIVRAPKPALMITTTRDIFSIQGARETAAEVARAYSSHGSDDHFSMVEDDAGHASTKKNREAMYAFFQRHLKNPGDAGDETIPMLTAEEMRVTPTGQVSTSLKGETVFSLNLAEMRRSSAKGPEMNDHAATVRNAQQLSGYRDPRDIHAAVFTGRIQRDAYAIEKYYVQGEGDYVVPFLLMTPGNANGKVVLYLHPGGKSAEAAPGGEMETLVKDGFTVLAPDLPAVGELGAGEFKGDAFISGISHNIWYSAMLVGRSIAGVQAGDIVRVLSSLETTRGFEVYAIARKEMTSTLLHAAAFYSPIKKVALIEPLSTFRSLVSNRFYQSSFITGAVPGMLRVYDLPDLAASLAPRDLLIINPLDGAGKDISEHEGAPAFEKLQQAYQRGGLLKLEMKGKDQAIKMVLETWSGK